MWVILRAEPGALIAHGLGQPVSRERLREAALSGEIEGLLNWVTVAPGDVLFAPAGVIHAIGAGIALCEIQQNSDVTYRLYDYGRPRELHIDRAVEVSRLEPGPARTTPVLLEQGRELLVRCEHFEVERVRLEPAGTCQFTGGLILVVLDGAGVVEGTRFAPGDAWLIPQGQPCEVRADTASSLLTARS
jgi:mannose-6-phosphate isomerase